jgi:hypothetical protein
MILARSVYRLTLNRHLPQLETIEPVHLINRLHFLVAKQKNQFQTQLSTCMGESKHPTSQVFRQALWPVWDYVLRLVCYI